MIQTKQFELTKAELFRINLQLAVKKSWLNFLLLPPVMLLSYQNREDRISFCLFVFGIAYFLFYAYHLYSVSYRNTYPLMFAARSLQFTSVQIRAEFSGTLQCDPPFINELPSESVIRSVKLKKYYLLYVSKTNFVLVPKDSFYTKEDEEAFKGFFFKPTPNAFKPLQ